MYVSVIYIYRKQTKGEQIMKYYVANHETGDLIEEVASVEEGNKLIAEYEESDKKEGIYEPDFYCVVEIETT